MMNSQINKVALTNGIVIAAITIFIQLITYYAAPSLLGATWYGIVITLVTLGVYVFFAMDLRKKIGGYWTFKEALSGIFVMSLVANVASSVFNFVFYRFVEPGAYDKVKGYVADGMTETFEKMGMSGDALGEAIESATESLKSQYMPSFTDFFKNIAIAILVGFVLSLIFAAILKKNPPLFTQVDENE